MIEQRTTATGKTSLRATNGLVHKHGTDIYVPEIIMLPGDTLDMYEEVAAAPEPTTEKEAYAAEVERLIAERYSTGKEIELLAERESNPEAWEEYRAYVARCKAQALANLNLTEKP